MRARTKFVSVLTAAVVVLATALPRAAWAVLPGETHATNLRVLKVRALGEPQTLDWNRASTWVEGFILRNMMEGLIGVDTRLQATPDLAVGWTSSPDHKTYTFNLRKEVRWSDGVPLTAQHFVDSWKRLLTKETAAKYASLLFDIENAEAFYKGDLKDFSKVGIKAVDEHTLQVRLRAAISFWHWMTAFYACFPIRQDLIDKYKTDWDKPGKLVTLGPFVLSSYDPGRTIVLEKNPYYFGKRGNIDQILVALVHDDSTALKLYDVGQVDFLSKIPSLEKKRLKGRKDFHTWPDLRTLHLRLNTNQGPMANIHLRRAIAKGIDRAKLTKIFEGAYKPASSFVTPEIMAYRKSGGMAFNLNEARAELKESGLDPVKLPPLDLLTVAFDDQVILAQFIQEELKRNLNLNVRIHILEPKRYYSPQLVHNDYAMQINFWGADYPDPDNFYSVFLSNSGLNRYKWKNEQYDELVLAARSQSQRSEREKSYQKAEKILLEDSVATIPLYYARISGLVREHIKGFSPGPMDWWAFKELSIK